MIFNVSELELIDFTQVCETSAETVRKSVDETKTFVKWDGEMPDCINNLTTKENNDVSNLQSNLTTYIGSNDLRVTADETQINNKD